jgi:hypothetical protein
MGHHPFINTAGALAVAGLSTVASLLISLWCIYMHLQNYSVPRYVLFVRAQKALLQGWACGGAAAHGIISHESTISPTKRTVILHRGP